MRRPPTMRSSLIITAAATLGCGHPPSDGCGQGTVVLELDPARSGFPKIEDGADVPVFVPPQGGIFTELDLHVRGIVVDDIEQVRVTIDPTTGARIADQIYPGFAVPLLCDGAGTASVPRMPVRFDEGLELHELEGIEGDLTLTVATSDSPHERQWTVRLRVTGY